MWMWFATRIIIVYGEFSSFKHLIRHITTLDYDDFPTSCKNHNDRELQPKYWLIAHKSPLDKSQRAKSMREITSYHNTISNIFTTLVNFSSSPLDIQNLVPVTRRLCFVYTTYLDFLCSYCQNIIPTKSKLLLWSTLNCTSPIVSQNSRTIKKCQ